MSDDDNICNKPNLKPNITALCQCKKASEAFALAVENYEARQTEYIKNYKKWETDLAAWQVRKAAEKDSLINEYKWVKDNNSAGDKGCNSMSGRRRIEEAKFDAGCGAVWGSSTCYKCIRTDEKVNEDLNTWVGQNPAPIKPEQPTDVKDDLPSINCCSQSFDVTGEADFSQISQQCNMYINNALDNAANGSDPTKTNTTPQKNTSSKKKGKKKKPDKPQQNNNMLFIILYVFVCVIIFIVCSSCCVGILGIGYKMFTSKKDNNINNYNEDL